MKTSSQELTNYMAYMASMYEDGLISTSSYMEVCKLRYPYRIKCGGKVCTVCGKYSPLKKTSCVKCHICFKTGYRSEELETLALEFAIAEA